MIIAPEILKPSLWCPGRNPDAWELWKGCVGYWPFWEGAGSILHDLSPYGRNATLNNIEAADWAAHERGMALDLDGIAEYGSVGSINMVGWGGISAFILFSWDNPGPGAEHTLVSNWFFDGATGYANLLMRLEPSNNRLEFHIGIESDPYFINGLPPGTEVNDTNWHTMALTFGGGTARAYLDGVVSGTTYSGSLGSSPSAADFQIGRTPHQHPFDFFNGRLGLVALWDRGLGALDVATLAADPFCMMRQPDFAPFWDVGAAPAVGNPWYYYQQMAAAAGV